TGSTWRRRSRPGTGSAPSSASRGARARGGRANGPLSGRGARPMKDRLLRIVGVPASPYSRKLRAVLRYRRIPHVWVLHGSAEARGLPQPRVPLLPQLIFPGADEAAIDSTPLIRRLESMYAARALIPPDP